MGFFDRRRTALARLVAEEVAKAAAPDETKASVPGIGHLPAGTRTIDATAMVNNLSAGHGNVAPDGTAALPRNDPPVPFGPGFPVVPASIDPRLRSGRSAPRRSEYPVSWNLPGQGQPHVPFSILRDFASSVDMARRAIEVRKAQLVELDWSITIRPEAIEAVMAATGEGNHARAASLARAKYQDEINRLKVWWEKPDRINNHSFGEWLSMLLEEYFVIDALAIYPHLNLKGQLHSLELLDGSTVKPLLDHRGAVPQPPNPAYQQILYGFPRGEFQASSDPDEEFATDQLIYKHRYQRTNSPYGMSPTEQALIAGDLYLKRQEWVRAEFTAGVTPEMVITTDADLTPEQLQWYEEIFNEELEGQTARRHRARFLPRGMTPAPMANFADKYKPEYDEHLIKVLCSHYDVMPSEIGFAPSRQGLGGKGLAEGQEDSGERKKRQMVKWLVDVMNDISSTWLDMPRGLTFHALGGEIDDQAALAQTRDLQLKGAQRTLNDIRAEMGMPLYDFPEADMPFMVTGTGVVFMDGSSKLPGQPGAPAPAPVPGGDTAGPAKPAEPKPATAPDPHSPTPDQQGAAGPGTPKPPTAPPAPVVPSPAAQKAADEELRAFLSFAGKRAKAQKTWRSFAFQTVEPEMAGLLNRYGAAGDLDSVRALAFGYIDALEKSATLSKEAANYREASAGKCCGNCSMIRLNPPDFESCSCTLVEGTIDPADVCDRWEAETAEKAAHDVSDEARDDHGRFGSGSGGVKPAGEKKPKKPAAKTDDDTLAQLRSRTPGKKPGEALNPEQRAQHVARIRGDHFDSDAKFVPPKTLEEFQTMVRQAMADPMVTHHMMSKKYAEELVKATKTELHSKVTREQDAKGAADAVQDFKTHAACILGGLALGAAVAAVPILLPIGIPVIAAALMGVGAAGAPALVQEALDLRHHNQEPENTDEEKP